jgi:hypothetical protein
MLILAAAVSAVIEAPGATELVLQRKTPGAHRISSALVEPEGVQPFRRR